MAKKKTDRLIIKLVDKEPDVDGIAYSPSVYWTEKNKRKTTDKLKLKKYNPYKRKHTVHTETK
ncbi:MAG: 50S ribosomal protein L33 [Candidatus Caenarcaniphilales bacterium]|nr:50S ribosomal protein L33 [Candidatus Caenarcaniphilales bacterium]